ncbi:MAG: cofactor assembly of complex C subunit B, partial [Cyanobacteria bacterium J06607_10]
KNTQGVICQPLGDVGVLLLGANAPRSYTQQDEAWIAGIADKLADSLHSQQQPVESQLVESQSVESQSVAGQ